MKFARTARVWGATLLVAGALLAAAAPASAATEATSHTTAATQALPAPTLVSVQCAGSCNLVDTFWTAVSGADHYEFFVGGRFLAAVTGSPVGGNQMFFEFMSSDPFDPRQTWTVRAVDAAGNVSPMGNGIKPIECC
ncbi:hypothetical protein ACFLIM_42425 [Nonomuraea sp. M3C6]|uniref:Uncharacterized protein n=1 Tax=Nonomuraea marmarensis TaxID=3351344 RepID=A0ABW7AS15_9ACTN